MGVRGLFSNVGITRNEYEIVRFLPEETPDFVVHFRWWLHWFMSRLLALHQTAVRKACPVYHIRVHIWSPVENFTPTGETPCYVTLPCVIKSRACERRRLGKYILVWPGSKTHESVHLYRHIWELLERCDIHGAWGWRHGGFRHCPPCRIASGKHDVGYSE